MEFWLMAVYFPVFCRFPLKQSYNYCNYGLMHVPSPFLLLLHLHTQLPTLDALLQLHTLCHISECVPRVEWERVKEYEAKTLMGKVKPKTHTLELPSSQASKARTNLRHE